MIHENFFISIGAQKAASTWLHRQLYTHPQIWVPPLKELRYFDHLEDPETSREWLLGRWVRNRKRGLRAWLRWKRTPGQQFDAEFMWWLWRAHRRIRGKSGFDYYRSLFSDKRPADYRAFGELTPTYSTLNEAGFAKLREHLPQAKLLFVMRDPVQRAWSMAKSIAIRSRHKPELLRDDRYLQRYVKPGHHLRCSRYDWTLDALDATFPRGQVMLEFYEDIFASRESVKAFLERLCAFIGIDHGERFFPRIDEVIWNSPKAEIHEQALRMFEPLYAPVHDYLVRRMGRVPGNWGEWQRSGG